MGLLAVAADTELPLLVALAAGAAGGAGTGGDFQASGGAAGVTSGSGNGGAGLCIVEW